MSKGSDRFRDSGQRLYSALLAIGIAAVPGYYLVTSLGASRRLIYALSAIAITGVVTAIAARFLSPALETEPQPEQEQGWWSNRRGFLTLLGAAFFAATGGALVRTFGAPFRVAVVRLSNGEDDKEEAEITEGLASSIVRNLQLLRVAVTAYSTSGKFRLLDSENLKAVARDLAVPRLLSLSYHAASSPVDARLLDARTGKPDWTFPGDRDLVSAPAIIALEVARVLKVNVDPDKAERLRTVPTSSPEAFIEYLRGRYHWDQRTPDGLMQARRLLQAAIDRDGRFGLACAALADCFNMLGHWHVEAGSEVYPKAIQWANQALAIDPAMAEGKAALAYSTHLHDWDWRRAESHFREAIELNPSYAPAFHWFGLHLATVGRMDEGSRSVRKAVQLEPDCRIIRSSLVWLNWLQGNNAEAISICEELASIDRDFAPLSYYCGLAHVAAGNFTTAISLLKKASEHSQGNSLLQGTLGYALAAAGRKKEARALAERLEAARDSDIAPVDVANIYVGLRDLDRAFEWLRQGVLRKDSAVLYLKVSPLYRDLRSDPRYAALLDQLGLRSA